MKKSLFGYALTTKALAKTGGWDIYDDKFKEISQDEYRNLLLPTDKFDASKSELEIPSPGFPPTHNLVKNARNLISEYDYFKDIMPVSVWVSGTNGKTTTTKMTQFLLEKYGSDMGGNVGNPLATLNKNAKIWILETSSFTLHYTKLASPNVYVLLPITPDHISWHGSMQEYEKAKLKPVLSMKEGSVAILPKKYKGIESLAQILYYEDEKDLEKICGVESKNLTFKTPFLMDALMALCIEKILFDKADFEFLNNFIIEPNKLEEIQDKFGRLWVNDTKATNIDAALQAFKRYKEFKIHAIIGGDDKGVDLSEIFEILSKQNAVIYAIGSNTNKIINLSAKFNLKAFKCEFLDIAVKEISKTMKKENEVGLLSPACASLDQFSSYAQRGDEFKKFINLL